MSKKNIVKFEQVGKMIIELRGIKVIIDADVATLYGVETKEVNQAVKNNPGKFPDGYVISVSKEEKDELVKNFYQFNKLKAFSCDIESVHGKRFVYACNNTEERECN